MGSNIKSELTEEEREKENLIKEIERALHALEKCNTGCPLPIPTPEEISARSKFVKNITDEYLKKADDSRKN